MPAGEKREVTAPTYAREQEKEAYTYTEWHSDRKEDLLDFKKVGEKGGFGVNGWGMMSLG